METRRVKRGVACTISLSHWNGMSPQTMSKSSTPRDQTVRETASYELDRIHSGGL